jgi:hypothetical protein
MPGWAWAVSPNKLRIAISLTGMAAISPFRGRSRMACTTRADPSGAIPPKGGSHRVLGVSRTRNPEPGNWKLETGNWQLEAGSWQPEAGS